jgi:predicted transcriptional regulator
MKTLTAIQEEKKEIIESIAQTNDEALISTIKTIIDYAKSKDEEWLGESIEEYNLALEKADAEIDAGSFIVHEEAIKKLGEWRNKEK